ncbi:MAG TPA: PAS domain S-box protein [Candidatus Methanoperedens sp.]
MMEKNSPQNMQKTVRFFEKQLCASADGIVITDPAKNIIFVNDTFCKFFSRTKQDVIETNIFVWLAKLGPNAKDSWKGMEIQIKEHGIAKDVEFMMKYGEEMRYFSVNSSLIKNNGIEYAGLIISNWHDDTERKRAEEALRENKDYYGALFSQVSDAVYIIEQETGRVLDVNEAACRIYGYTREEWVKMKNTDVSAEPNETIKATKEPPNIIPVRYHRKKDGTVFPLEMNLNTFNLHGRKTILVTARDITERKWAENQIQASHKEKEILLKEIHHRVKNNMQLISSLLGLQSMSSQDKKFAEIFRDSQNRINSISLIHDKLYHSKDLATLWRQ